MKQICNFYVIVRLRSPIILGRYPVTLDDLLAGIAYEQHKRSVPEPLIGKFHDVPQASQALPAHVAAPFEMQVATYYRSFMRDLQNDRDMLFLLDKQPPQSALSRGTGNLSNIDSTYTLLDIPAVYFLARGDMAAVRQRLATESGETLVPAIGGQRHKGHGQVRRIDVYPAPEDNPLFGIVGRHRGRNLILRPFPVRMKALLPEDVDATISDQTWRAPYWRRRPGAVVENCMIPPFRQGEGIHEGELDELATITA